MELQKNSFQNYHRFAFIFRLLGLGIALFLIFISIQNRNLGLLGFAFIIFIPLYLFVALWGIPEFSIGVRAFISFSTSALGDAIYIAVDNFMPGGTEIVYWWALLVFLVLICLIIIIVLLSIFYAFQKRKTEFVTSVLLLFMVSACIGISVSLQFANLGFYWRLPSYEAIIQLVKDRELVPNSYGIIDTPPEYGFMLVHVNNSNDEFSFFFHGSALIDGYFYNESKTIPSSFKCEKIKGQNSWFYCVDEG